LSLFRDTHKTRLQSDSGLRDRDTGVEFS
jgi:hypothetical protein